MNCLYLRIHSVHFRSGAQKTRRGTRSAAALRHYTVRSELNRAGDVIEIEVSRSSGNAVLDREAIDLLRRASPFPAFPVAKQGTRDIYLAPVSFAR